MKKMIAFIGVGALLLLATLYARGWNPVTSNSNEKGATGITNGKQVNSKVVSGKKITDKNGAVIFGNVQYKADFMPALKFLKRKGEVVAETDKAGLRKEAVLLLEMQVNEGVKNIFDSKQLQLNNQEATEYLMGAVAKDITLTQGKNEFEANAVQYDGNLSGANKLRVFLFYTDIDANKETKIKYYDRLFGAGLVNLK